MLNLNDAVIALNGLGEKTAGKLANLGIYTIQHLLFHLPHRYQDKTKITPLNQAQIDSEVLIQLKIERIEQSPAAQQQLLCYLSDEAQGKLLLRFFHFTQYQRQNFVRGDIIQCFGELKMGRHGLEMFHPEYRLLTKSNSNLLAKTLTPVYPLTANIRQLQMKKWIDGAFKVLAETPLKDYQDYFQTLKNNTLPSLKQALETIHHPPKNESLEKISQFNHPCQQRLIIEELCAHQLALLQLKKQRKSHTCNSFTLKFKHTNALLKSLQFTLTKAQKRSINEINADLSKQQPMHRLLQGDVGSGKTIVAVFTCLQAIENGFQAAIMTPTEILALQHFSAFSNYLNPLNINIALLTGSQSAKDKTAQLTKIKSAKTQLIIGTHALFQEAVVFKKLGLIIIDEQHKFGVHQRLTLAQKSDNTPHQLVMTATPIPRSLTMSAYADLDCSVIDELPQGRKPIKTIALNNEKKEQIIEKIKQVCSHKNQVYWVCTLIEESEVLRAQSAKNTYDYLQHNLPDLTIRLIHGKSKKQEKAQIMEDFTNAKINVLVATTVIEVGLDVPNANLMVIENAERLGLAQLHQLRGRVGRGFNDSLCILLYQSPLEANARQRIDILRQTNDGFKIAQKDLELRGPGEILGTQQTGIINMKIADIPRDIYLLETVKDFSQQLLTQLKNDAKQALIARWVDAEKTQYANI